MRFPLLAFLLLALPPFVQAGPHEFRLASPDFAPGAAIPARFTCQGQNLSPTLDIYGVPAAAQSLVLIVDDPDAPSGTFTHWLVWNIPPETTELRWLPDAAVHLALVYPHHSGEARFTALEGTNDFGSAGYSGPCPPSGTHRYFFRLSALNTTLHLAAGASRSDLDAAIQGHVIATTLLMGRYAKTASQ
jgi:Raf kinase inhibitor-like YbhB/YbcL family protein